MEFFGKLFGEHFWNPHFWALWLITLWLLIGVGIIVERAMYLWKSSINRDVFIATMQKCILAGDVGRAIKLCSASNAPLGRIVKAGLMRANQSDAQVQAAMDEAALRELPKIESRTGYLALMSNLAMLSGLFGTVLGLINAFAAVGRPGIDEATKQNVLALGISEAMFCTGWGLFSALICLIGFAVLNGKTQKLLDDINGATVQTLNLVTNNRSQLNLQQAA